MQKFEVTPKDYCITSPPPPMPKIVFRGRGCHHHIQDLQIRVRIIYCTINWLFHNIPETIDDICWPSLGHSYCVFFFGLFLNNNNNNMSLWHTCGLLNNMSFQHTSGLINNNNMSLRHTCGSTTTCHSDTLVGLSTTTCHSSTLVGLSTTTCHSNTLVGLSTTTCHSNTLVGLSTTTTCHSCTFVGLSTTTTTTCHSSTFVGLSWTHMTNQTYICVLTYLFTNMYKSKDNNGIINTAHKNISDTQGWYTT